MIRVNPELQNTGSSYMPINSVTARFAAGTDSRSISQALTQFDFEDNQVEIFTGTTGAERLDPEGKSSGPWVKFVRSLGNLLTDQNQLLKRADETLRSGGSVVAVYTNGEEEERQRASEILKSHGGEDIVYWGQWVTENL